MSEKARILQVVEANAGGVSGVLRELVAALTREGYEVTVAYSPLRGRESEEAARAYALSGARVVAVPMRRSPNPWSDLRCFLALRRLMRDGEYDIVHCHSTKAGVLGRAAARAAGVRSCLYSPHAYAIDGARTAATAWCIARVEQFLTRWTGTLVALSQYEVAQALALGMPLSSVTAIPNGTRIQPTLERKTGPIVRLGAVGRLVRQKGFDVLLRAMHEVQRHHPEVGLAIAGEGPQRNRLLGLAKKLGIKVEFAGKVDSLQDWLQSVDLYVHPARWEGLPLALLEAMSCGVPVVASAVGGIPELVHHGRTGLLARSEDPRSLAVQISEAIKDPDSARERSLRAREDITNHYSIECFASRYLELYDRILSLSREGHPTRLRETGEQAASAVKLLAVADGFPAWSETFVMGEVAGLRKLGMDCRVFAMRRGPLEITPDCPVMYSRGMLGDLVYIGFPGPRELVRHLRALFELFGRDPRWIPFGLARITTATLAARLARGLGSTSIHAHFLGATTIVGACAAAIAGIPFSISPHASLAVFSRAVQARLLKRAAFTAACWKGATEILSDIGPRVHFVPHGVEMTSFRGARGTSPVFRIIAIARLVEKKGVDLLVDAVGILSERALDWQAAILGDGPLRQELELKAARSPARGRIKWLGFVPHGKVSMFLNDADVLVVPSVPVAGETEGIPNVILEAFAAGVPVVASDTGGIREVVRHRETGILVPPGNAELLAQAILRVRNGEENLEAIVASARELVARHHAWSSSLRTLAELHRSAAGSGS